MTGLNRRRIAAGVLGLVVTEEGLAAAPSMQAYDTATMKVSCNAVKSHKKSSKSSTIVGIDYKHNTVRFDQLAYRARKRTWYSRGTVTRRLDGKRVRGHAIYRCVNPNGATCPRSTRSVPSPRMVLLAQCRRAAAAGK
ncbi:hypothetical protein [Streptomyces phaeochromogenes]|uniref:hypothetical protein n=1 Tax=Streptomyces phaeochromogenes TaxID=1923 RepID=UPI0036750198